MDNTKPLGARARARQEITAEILATARRHLSEVGGAGLSLRAIARELEMVSSALYRYFPSRDELLTRLIADSFSELADRATESTTRRRNSPTARRLSDMATTVRSWALEHPHDFALIYGTPIPGYVAPRETAVEAERLAVAMFSVLRDGVDRGEVTGDDRIETTRALRSDLGALRPLAQGLDDATITRALLWWSHLIGHISLELFGHLHNVIDDRDAFFELQLRHTIAALVRTSTSSGALSGSGDDSH